MPSVVPAITCHSGVVLRRPAARSRPGSCRRSRPGRRRSWWRRRRRAPAGALVVVELVGLERPHGDRQEAGGHDPAQHFRRQPLRDQRRRTRPASAWLSRVATRMPATIGQGLRKRAASSRASSWVLSPISASATVPVETSSGHQGKSSMRTPGPGIRVDAKGKRHAARPGVCQLLARRLPSVLPVVVAGCVPAGCRSCAMAMWAKCVDAGPRGSPHDGGWATPRRREVARIVQAASPGARLHSLN